MKSYHRKQSRHRYTLSGCITTTLFLTVIVTVVVNSWFLFNNNLFGNASNDEINVVFDDVGRLRIAQNQINNKHLSDFDQAKKSIAIEVISSRTKVAVSIDSITVLEASTERNRGIHIAVINEYTGSIMAIRKFDTYGSKADESMVVFLSMVSDGRILCFAILDEGTFSLKKHARQVLAMLGSQYALTIKWRDMWAMIVEKNGRLYSESRTVSAELSQWGEPCKISKRVPLRNNQDSKCQRPDNDENRRRNKFCDRYEGYGQLCACKDPLPIDVQADTLANNRVAKVPIAVIASNRPYYLYRMLRTLLSAKGVQKSLINVFIDGFYNEPLAVGNLFGIRTFQHKPISQKNGRIAQHYKASLSAAFDLYPEAEYLIILEEDLDVARDFFSYFSQTISLLDDEDIYCISAWNDQGYKHSSNDPSQLYRVETMPGLGWMLKRSLFKKELEPSWPSPNLFFDWDMWMRTTGVRKGRECVIPDVSRTYHFGSEGVNMNSYFQDAYFTEHKINTDENAVLRGVEDLRKTKYEKLIHRLVKNAQILNHDKTPCDNNFLPNTTDKTYVLYIQMNKTNDYETWLQVAKCWKLWDLDVRGFHKCMWRFWIKKNHIVIVGYPVSPYSEHKPINIKPLFMKSPTKPPKKKT